MIRHLIARRGSVPKATATGAPIVLLHGTLGSPGNAARLAALCNDRGHRVIAPEYGNRGTAPLATCVRQVRELLIDTANRYGRIDIVAHSYGGLIALIACQSPQLRGRIGRLVGLGACWHGMPEQPYWVRPFVRSILGPSYTDIMHPFHLPIPEGMYVHSIVSTADRVVPRASATLGTLTVIDGVPHPLLFDALDPICTALGFTSDKADTSD